jgi:hypothetical protein
MSVRTSADFMSIVRTVAMDSRFGGATQLTRRIDLSLIEIQKGV